MKKKLCDRICINDKIRKEYLIIEKKTPSKRSHSFVDSQKYMLCYEVYIVWNFLVSLVDQPKLLSKCSISVTEGTAVDLSILVMVALSSASRPVILSSTFT